MHQQWRYNISYLLIIHAHFKVWFNYTFDPQPGFHVSKWSSKWSLTSHTFQFSRPVKYVKKGLRQHLVNEEYDMANRNNKIKHKCWHYPIILFLLLVFQFYYIILFHLLVDGRNLFDVQVPHSRKIWVLFLVVYVGWILPNEFGYAAGETKTFCFNLKFHPTRVGLLHRSHLVHHCHNFLHLCKICLAAKACLLWDAQYWSYCPIKAVY